MGTCKTPSNLFEVVLDPSADTACLVLYEYVLTQRYPKVKLKDLECTYQEIVRNTDATVIDRSFKFGSAKPLEVPTSCPREEFILIKCKFNGFPSLSYMQPVLLPKLKPLKNDKGNAKTRTPTVTESNAEYVGFQSNI